MGNKPAALPAWPCAGAGPTDGMPGRELSGSGEVLVIGGADGGGACGGGGAGSAGGAGGGAAGVGCVGRVGCVVAEVLGAVMATAAAAVAALVSCIAVPVALRLTDFTPEAATGTVS